MMHFPNFGVMMKKTILLSVVLFWVIACSGQDAVSSFYLSDSVRVTIDKEKSFAPALRSIIVFYALPNGNSTEQTMGKKLQTGDDWHFDIQHIKAQTIFIRKKLRHTNLVVIYLENNYKSWPAWKQRHSDYKVLIPHIIDTLSALIPGDRKSIYLNGHSGGGSFIFGYLAGVDTIPSSIQRISFLDSDYGYDSSYYPKLKQWLKEVKGAALNVFAYNDSVALYNGKPIVSATGGTWYRSHLLLNHLNNDFSFSNPQQDTLTIYKNDKKNIQFFFKTNPDRKIFHTTQVELNGFIHAVLCGTPYDSRKYRYYGKRAYAKFIR